jgi:lysophospholipase L1-like esterase
VKKKWVYALLFPALLAASAVTARPKERPHANNNEWVGTWASSPQLGDAGNAPPALGFVDSALRQVIHVSIGGKQIRVRFSNAFGATALTISSAHVALSTRGGSIRVETDKTLTFHGESSVTIPPGALMYSDPLDFDLAPLSDLALTIHLNGAPDGVTTHPGSRTTSYFLTGNSVSAADLPSSTHADHWYFLNGVDVNANQSAAAIVTLGDSITDGSKSTTNGNGRWPDDLARRLHANRRTADIGILNEGIGGNRLVHDGAGPNTLARLDRDVLAQSGVRWLIVLEGINDLGTRATAASRNEQPAAATDLITAYEQIILRAHAHNILVYGATILPCEGAAYFSADLEANRQTINNWIRTSHKFDAVIDFDMATRDPQHPSRLLPAADSGDHLHPADAGYKIMGDQIDLKLFE